MIISDCDLTKEKPFEEVSYQWTVSQLSRLNSPQPYILYSYKSPMWESGSKMLPKVEHQHFSTYVFAFACLDANDFK